METVMSDMSATTPSEGEPAGGAVSIDRETVGANEFKDSFGEEIAATLDLDSWSADANLQGLYERLGQEVRGTIAQERRIRQFVRDELFPMLASRPNAPAEAGVYRARIEQLEAVHRKVLFPGLLETCDGTVVTHETMLLTVTQIGVCLLSYQGDHLTLSQRLYRRDLRSTGEDPLAEAKELLRRRQSRAASGVEDRRDTLSELARRGIMAYAERAVLLERSDARWRMGHGNPAPYELVTGSGSMDLLEAGASVVERLVCDHRRFVFVPSSIKDRLLLTVGDALDPLEYAVVDTATERILQIVDNGHYERSRRADGRNWHQFARDFATSVGPSIVIGVYRASPTAPARPFFAHPDHVHEAALVAMADSVLQEHRGFPLSIDLADTICRTAFGLDVFTEAVRSAYADAGEPFRHLSERDTRK
jgi:hypothetical protein